MLKEIRGNKKGFTLIELMVVIAIIAILATVVLVALQSARDAAEDSNRKSAVAQARSLAEVEYAIAQNYDGFAGNNEVEDLVAAYSDGNMAAFGSGQEYCVTVDLESGGDFCADNNNVPADYASSACASGNIACE